MELSPEVYNKALKNVIDCCNSLNADATVLHERNTSVLVTSSSVANSPADESSSPQTVHQFGHLLIRPRLSGKVEELSEVRICVTGNVDAGKSTLLGVLTVCF
jgi:GTPase